MKWLEQCPNKFKLVFTEDMLMIFHAYFNTCHPNMLFSFEQEVNGKLSFLDVEVSWQQVKFVITVYRKPTFSDVYTILIVFCQRITKLV